MARINTYAIDDNVTSQDKWIGTDAAGNITKNFTPENVTNWINKTNAVGIAGQTNFRFQNVITPERLSGTISFELGSGNGTQFSAINNIIVSKYGSDGNLILDYLEALVGTYILICQVDDTNNFGVYQFGSLTQLEDEPNFYNAVLTVQSSNGALSADEYYGVVAFPASSIVSVTGLESIDEGNGNGWRLIGRDPDNYGNIGLNAIDFSNSDAVSTERGSTGENAITFGNNNINQQSGSIVLGGNQSVKITDTFQGANIITGFDNFIWGATYSSLIAAYRSTIGVEGTNYTTNALYQSLIVGDGHNYYAGRDSGVVGGGLISGSTGCFTVGIANEDLTTTTSNWLTAQYNNYGPRFIVGCGTYTPTTGVAGVRQNGFVVMSDGTATFPIGNVGIGTSTPNLYTGYTTLTLDNSAKGGVIDLEKAATRIGSLNVNDGNFNIVNVAASSMVLFTNFQERVRIDSLGNVGIGTTSPSTNLQLGTFGAANQEFRIESNGNSYFSVSTTNGLQRIYAGGAGTQSNEMAFYTSNSGSELESMRIDSSGNVGIGTTSPASLLDVSGAITLSSAADATSYLASLINLDLKADNDNNSSAAYSNIRFFSKGSELARITSTGNVGIGTTTPSTKLDVVGEIKSDKTANGVSFSSTGGGSAFTAFDVFTATNGGLLRLYDESAQTVNIDGRSAGGNSYFNNGGSVGIGTTSPGRRFEVRIDNNDEVARFSAPLSNDAYLEIYNGSAVGIPKFGTVVNDFVFINDGSSEKMRIANSGNVGIGTTNPSSKLYIVETGTIAPALKIDTTRYGASIVGDGTSNSQYLLNLQSNGGSTEVMRVQSSGNVGIGTTSPNQKLHVVGNINIEGLNPIIYLTDTNGADWNIDLEDNHLRFKKDSTEYIRFQNGGNVGIGTTSPDTKLHVQGSTIIQDGVGDNNKVFIGNFSNYSNQRLLLTVDGSGNSKIQLNANNKILTLSGDNLDSGGLIKLLGRNAGNAVIFNTLNGERMRITDTGNVGIGTTIPAYKLELGGSALSDRTIGINGDPVIYYPDQLGSAHQYSIALGNGLRNSTNTGGNAGTRNTAIGVDNQLNVTTGDSNVSLGSSCLEQLTTGTSNIAIGHLSSQLSNGSGNVFIGFANSRLYTSGQSNVSIGRNGSYYDTSGNIVTSFNRGVYIGENTKLSAASGNANEIVIGYEAEGLGSNTVVLGNNSIVTTALKGNVGIGTTSPSEKLDVDGNIKLGATTGRQLMFGENKYGAIRLGNNTVIGGNQAVDIRTGNAALSSQSSRVFINQVGFVGVGTTTPIATLDVNGPIKMGNATTTPLSTTVGTMRYRADSNNSYVEMIMQTGPNAADYEWVVIKQNTW